MIPDPCDQCGASFYATDDGRFILARELDDGSLHIVGRYCTIDCLATYTIQRADQSTPQRRLRAVNDTPTN
jgi:hypothetical protein